MLSPLVDKLERSYPGLARRLGDRPDLQLSALGVSVLTHLMFLVVLGLIGYAAHDEGSREIRSEMVVPPLDDFARLDTNALTETDEPTIMTPVAGSFAPTLSPRLVETPPTAAPPKPPDLSKNQITLASGVVVPTVTNLSQSVLIRGTGAEHVGGVEGAVDRVAIEILRQMEQGRVLVVWAFDASRSLLVERQRLAKYIDGVYGHIAEMDSEGLAQDGGLLTAVVAFGQDRKTMTAEPTADRSAIQNAIDEVPMDKSGVETPFTTVADIARKWGRYRKDGQPYRVMCIVVTDEVGEDENRLEGAIAAANAVKMPVYVLGSPALFGRIQKFVNYTDPETGRTYFGLSMRVGPESVVPEGIRLPFWYDGPQLDFLDAGFGPYALSRLAGATGGIYFVTRMGGSRPSFDPAGMREYKPDWVSKDQYEAAVDRNRYPIRWAVIMASRITQQNLPGQPGLTFPPVDGPEFKEAMKRNQEIVARVEYTVNMALEPITAVVKRRDHETSRRWQAHYDLIRGRLLAMKLRCHEYNMACARMMKDPKKFANPASNAWRLVPSDTIESGDKAAAVAAEAQALLQRVVDNHPGTPWALLAQRERKDPFGFRWEETKLPPIPRPRESDVAAAKKKMPRKAEMPRPAEVPKL